MQEEILRKIQEFVAQNEKIGVLVGKNPNIDQMAAALSLYLGLSSIGKSVSVASPMQPIVELSSIVGINKVKQVVSSDSGDLIVSFPYQEGEIEKVSYTLENGLLNIIVKAGEKGLSFDQQDVLYKRAGMVPRLLFIVGTPRLSDLGELFDPESLKDTLIVNIDNASDNEGFGDVVFVSLDYSSVSEMATSVLLQLGVTIDTDIAQNLFSGVSFATDNFQKPSTSPFAFEFTGLFLKKGAKRPQQQQQLQSQNGISDRSFSFPKPQQRQPDFGIKDQTRKMPRQQPFVGRQQFQPQQQQPALQRSGQASGPQQQQHAPVISQRPVQNQMEASAEKQEKPQEQEAPPDWLTPKVYKGSTLL